MKKFKIEDQVINYYLFSMLAGFSHRETMVELISFHGLPRGTTGAIIVNMLRELCAGNTEVVNKTLTK